MGKNKPDRKTQKQQNARSLGIANRRTVKTDRTPGFNGRTLSKGDYNTTWQT